LGDDRGEPELGRRHQIGNVRCRLRIVVETAAQHRDQSDREHDPGHAPGKPAASGEETTRDVTGAGR
jgi:hypothetical protein